MLKQDKLACMEIIHDVFAMDGAENLDFLFNYYYKEGSEILIKEHCNVVGFLFGEFYEKKDPMDIIQKEEDILNAFATGTQLNYILYIRFNGLKMKNYLKENDAFINLLAVSSKHQGKKIGRKLITKFIDYCEKNNIKNVFLWTDTSCNYRFYKKVRFEEIETFYNPYFFEDLNKTPNTIIYRYSIPSKNKQEII